MRLVIGAATDVGRVRDLNEDGYLVDEGIGLVALADGMGGHQGGEVASATALEALRAAVRSGRAVRDAALDANRAVFEKAQTDSALTGMGTTLTAGTMAAGNTFILVHVGDSRAYLLRDGAMTRVTTDHSHVQELVDDGQLTDDEAAVHPMRNIVTRALGLDPTLEVDVHPIELQVDDRIVLCSDGLTDMVHEDVIAAELRREPDPAVSAQKLVDRANAAGGVDNITVLVVAVADGPGDARSVVPVAGDVGEQPADPGPLPVDEQQTPGTVRSAGRPERAAKDAGRHRRRLKVTLWVVAVVAVFAVALGAVGWYARNSYYVGFATTNGRVSDRVTIYRGVPGGVLVWDPTVERTTALTRDDLRPADAEAVSGDKTFSSLADANAYVLRLRTNSTPATTTTTGPTSTTSTVTTTTPPTTTTNPPVGG